jgi:D-sedoheptulose 7-phosphate isomerase
MESFKSFLDSHFKLYEAQFEDKLQELLAMLESTRSTRKKVFIFGNGGSASSASHAVVDFVKTAKGNNDKSIFAINVSEMVALCSAYSNDINYENHFANILEDLSDSGDFALFLSVSGQSKNLIEAAKTCEELDVKSFAIVGSRGKPLLDVCSDGIIFDSPDYQLVEDLHLIIIHWLTRQLQES